MPSKAHVNSTIVLFVIALKSGGCSCQGVQIVNFICCWAVLSDGDTAAFVDPIYQSRSFLPHQRRHFHNLIVRRFSTQGCPHCISVSLIYHRKRIYHKSHAPMTLSHALMAVSRAWQPSQRINISRKKKSKNAVRFISRGLHHRPLDPAGLPTYAPNLPSLVDTPSFLPRPWSSQSR